jgi:hypothetical protein
MALSDFFQHRPFLENPPGMVIASRSPNHLYLPGFCQLTKYLHKVLMQFFYHVIKSQHCHTRWLNESKVALTAQFVGCFESNQQFFGRKEVNQDLDDCRCHWRGEYVDRGVLDKRGGEPEQSYPQFCIATPQNRICRAKRSLQKQPDGRGRQEAQKKAQKCEWRYHRIWNSPILQVVERKKKTITVTRHSLPHHVGIQEACWNVTS